MKAEKSTIQEIPSGLDKSQSGVYKIIKKCVNWQPKFRPERPKVCDIRQR